MPTTGGTGHGGQSELAGPQDPFGRGTQIGEGQNKKKRPCDGLVLYEKKPNGKPVPTLGQWLAVRRFSQRNDQSPNQSLAKMQADPMRFLLFL
jgi:hypothetical protein